MFKKITFVIALIMMLISIKGFAIDTYGGYDVPVDIEINGSFIKCAQKPVLIDGSAYIPLRAFSDAIGASVEWNDKELWAKITKDGHSFVFYPEKDYCLVDGVEKNYTSVIYNNLTFVPVRAISEVLKYDVNWDDFYLTVKITAPNVEVLENCKDVSYTYEDIMYLGKIIHIESGYQPFNVKIGVGNTVINRVKSPKFPNSVKEVIFDTKYGVQFPPAHTDKFNITPSKDSIIAAKCVLCGVNVARNSLYFINSKVAPSSWAHNNRPHYADMGGMSFYE